MKILAIGDPHGELEKVKKIPIKNIDLILLTGDLGSASLMRKMAFENIERAKQNLPKKKFTSKEEKEAFMEAYDSTMNIVKYLAKIALVYTIFGNVESSNFDTKKLTKKIKLKLPLLENDLNKIKNVKVINNQLIEFGGIRIGGLDYFIDPCWVKEFKPAEYKKRMLNAVKDSKNVKKVLRTFSKLNILVCHQPPYGVLDAVTSKYAPKHWIGKHAGSKIVLDFVKKSKPKYVCCGHIHEGEGEALIGKTKVYNLGVAGYKILEI